MEEMRLIDAMQTVTKLSGRITPLIQEGANPMRVYQEVLQVIAEAPTVDAVEVVRCQFCKYYNSIMGLCCVDRKLGQTIPPVRVQHSDFCSYGERRTD